MVCNPLSKSTLAVLLPFKLVDTATSCIHNFTELEPIAAQLEKDSNVQAFLSYQKPGKHPMPKGTPRRPIIQT